jgi:8-oxo-dGTP pyrophosphatase MutT (NUDIX family)
MRLNKIIYKKDNLDLSQKTFQRKAVRGVILQGKKLLMLYSNKYGDYAFPGGGMEKGESRIEALKREIREECGVKISSEIELMGQIIEYNNDPPEGYEIFKMTSYYYITEIEVELGSLDLEYYELELDLENQWIDVNKAIANNKEIIESQRETPIWALREVKALQYIKENIINKDGEENCV